MSRFLPGKIVLPVALVVLMVSGCEAPPAPKSGANEAPVPTAPGISDMGAKPGPVDADAPEEFTTTESGLKYRIRRKSEGRKPKASDSVVAHYRGWLDDGKEFDSSYKRNEPTPFPLNGVIPGWTEGLQLIGEGGMIELEIPSAMGYGERGFPPDIPPGATLHFIVELVKVN